MNTMRLLRQKHWRWRWRQRHWLGKADRIWQTLCIRGM